MELTSGAEPVEEPSLQYNILRKLKAFESGGPLPNGPVNLVATCCKFGLIFLADFNRNLKVYQSNEILDNNLEVVPALTVPLEEQPTNIAVNCEQDLLAVAGVNALYIFQIVNFQTENHNYVQRISFAEKTTCSFTAIQWNPAIPDMIAACFIDGTLAICKTDGNIIQSVKCQARCLCWSPKGKNIVIGGDGSFTQMKPTLQAVAQFAAPAPIPGIPVQVLAVHWVSNYQFLAVCYQLQENTLPYVAVVNKPKTGTPNSVIYENVYYCSECPRPWFFLLNSVIPWNILLIAVSNSIEISTLGSCDGSNWLQWLQDGEARPELPMTKSVENYPIGMTIDYTATPTGKPTLFVLSHLGLLTAFSVNNMKPDAPNLCVTPHNFALCKNTDLVPAQTAVKLPETDETVRPHVELRPQQNIEPQVSQPQQKIEPQVLHQQQKIEPQVSQPQQEFKPPTASHKRNIEPTIENENVAREENKERTNILPIKVPEKIDIASVIEKKNKKILTFLNEDIKSMNKKFHDLGKITKEIKFNPQLPQMLNEMRDSLNEHNAEDLRKNFDSSETKVKLFELELAATRSLAGIANALSHLGMEKEEPWDEVDPNLAKKVESIKSRLVYIQTQLRQASRALMSQYDGAEPERSALSTPKMEEIYQILRKTSEMISKQSAEIAAITEKNKSIIETTKQFKKLTIQTDKDETQPVRDCAKKLKRILHVRGKTLKSKSISMPAELYYTSAPTMRIQSTSARSKLHHEPPTQKQLLQLIKDTEELEVDTNKSVSEAFDSLNIVTRKSVEYEENVESTSKEDNLDALLAAKICSPSAVFRAATSTAKSPYTLTKSGIETFAPPTRQPERAGIEQLKPDANPVTSKQGGSQSEKGIPDAGDVKTYVPQEESVQPETPTIDRKQINEPVKQHINPQDKVIAVTPTKEVSSPTDFSLAFSGIGIGSTPKVKSEEANTASHNSNASKASLNVAVKIEAETPNSTFVSKLLGKETHKDANTPISSAFNFGGFDLSTDRQTPATSTVEVTATSGTPKDALLKKDIVQAKIPLTSANINLSAATSKLTSRENSSTTPSKVSELTITPVSSSPNSTHVTISPPSSTTLTVVSVPNSNLETKSPHSTNIFAAAAASTVDCTPTKSESVFLPLGTSSTSPSILGSPPSGSIFASPPAIATPQDGGVFSSSPIALSATPALSEATLPQSGTSTAATIAPATTSTAFAGFWQSQSASIFGAAPTVKTTSIFGSPSESSKIFTPVSSSPNGSIFGTPAAASGSVFGAPTTSPSIFGGGHSTGGVFASPTATTPSFGALIAEASTTSASIFSTGQSAGGLFTSPSATPPSVFGGTSGSIFGGSSPSNAGNIFGGGNSNSTSPFSTSKGSIFGGSPGFGSTTPAFGGNSAFGQTTSSPASGNIFAGSGAFTNSAPQTNESFASTNVFQQNASPSQTSVFGQAASPGFQSSGFGVKPAFGGSTAFGSGATFGGNAAFGSAFQKSSATFGGGASFGSPALNRSFGSTGSPTTTGFGMQGQEAMSFADQANEALTFGNLAQQTFKQPTQQQPEFLNAPSFTGWRG